VAAANSWLHNGSVISFTLRFETPWIRQFLHGYFGGFQATWAARGPALPVIHSRIFGPAFAATRT
jgi:hypothetical protein